MGKRAINLATQEMVTLDDYAAPGFLIFISCLWLY